MKRITYSEETARRIQYFGEQDPRFHNAEMKRHRAAWKAVHAAADVCNFGSCRNKAVFYGVCRKHCAVEE